jgi:hypothetical protein
LYKTPKNWNRHGCRIEYKQKPLKRLDYPPLTRIKGKIKKECICDRTFINTNLQIFCLGSQSARNTGMEKAFLSVAKISKHLKISLFSLKYKTKFICCFNKKHSN